MELTEFATNKIVPFITGDNGKTKKRTGRELVDFFNEYGFRDIYSINGGLPKLPGFERNSSLTEYSKNRLFQLSGKEELKLLLENLVNSLDNADECVKEINDIIIPEKYSIEKINGKYIVLGCKIVKKQEVKNDAHFIDIQNNILAELDKAQVSISVAMAWFTNKVLFEKLLEKQKEGVNVQLVIYDDGVNAKHGVDVTQLDAVKIRAERGGIMHDKFCIIDNHTVITGSYNWSDNAEFKNEENITIETDNEQANRFSVKFRDLRKQIKK